MGARRQITFYDQRTSGATVRPDGSGQFLFTRDVGGDEFFQASCSIRSGPALSSSRPTRPATRALLVA